MKKRSATKRQATRPNTDALRAVTARAIPGPAQPPTIKPLAPVVRRLRYTGLQSGTPIGFTGTSIDNDFALPAGVTQFWVRSLQAYAFASTTESANIVVIEASSNRTFADDSPIGQTPARVGIEFSPLQRITPILPTSLDNIFTVEYTGLESVLDLTIEYLA